MSRGACQGKDPDIFFPIAARGPALDQISAAKAICDRCTVRLPCLHFAVATMQDGICAARPPKSAKSCGDRRSPLSTS